MKKILVTLVCALAAGGVFAQGAASSTAAPAAPAAKSAHAPKHSARDHVEARIKQLHSELKITPAEEQQWNDVAQVMRDNAANLDSLLAARHDKVGTMNAVDDLKSYGDIAQAHADGVKKLSAVFDTLYASLSDTQKKLADQAFDPRTHHRSHKQAKSAAKSASKAAAQAE
jgi:hypothetical protein